MSEIGMAGLDLAKNVFQAHGADAGAICEAAERPTMRFVPARAKRRRALRRRGRRGQGGAVPVNMMTLKTSSVTRCRFQSWSTDAPPIFWNRPPQRPAWRGAGSIAHFM